MLPRGDDGLYADLKLHDTNLSFIKSHDGDRQRIGQSGQAIRLVIVVKRVENLDYSIISYAQSYCLQ